MPFGEGAFEPMLCIRCNESRVISPCPTCSNSVRVITPHGGTAQYESLADGHLQHELNMARTAIQIWREGHRNMVAERDELRAELDGVTALASENSRLLAANDQLQRELDHYSDRPVWEEFVEIWRQRPAWYRLLYWTARISFKGGYLAARSSSSQKANPVNE
jgi:hypothetical protein